MSLQRAIIRQGTSIIDKQDIRSMRNHRVVVLTQGPDLALFSHPGILTRLALWLVDALRDKLPGTVVGVRLKKKSLPFVVACLNEPRGRYSVVGILAALDFGQIRKKYVFEQLFRRASAHDDFSQFSQAFLEAQRKSNADIQYGSFDLSIMEIDQKDLRTFLDALCEY
jgi:cell division control protein 45